MFKLLLLSGSCSTGFGALSTVLRTAAATLVNAKAVQSTTNDVVTNTGQVLHTATANKNDGVLLKVVTLTADLGDNFFAIGKANFSNFTKSGVRLLRRTRHHLKADATTLRTAMKSARLRLLFRYDTSFADELINGRHVSFFDY